MNEIDKGLILRFLEFFVSQCDRFGFLALLIIITSLPLTAWRLFIDISEERLPYDDPKFVFAAGFFAFGLALYYGGDNFATYSYIGEEKSMWDRLTSGRRIWMAILWLSICLLVDWLYQALPYLVSAIKTLSSQYVSTVASNADVLPDG